jgi:hypothetical protein
LAAEIDHLQLEQLKMRLAIVERPLHFLTHYAVIYVVSPTVFFWLTVEKEADVAAVKAKALKALTRNGLKIDQAGVKESTSAFAGIDSTESVYSAIADNGQPRTVKIRAVAIGNNRFIRLAQWGPQAAFDQHAAALTKIFASVKLAGK